MTMTELTFEQRARHRKVAALAVVLIRQNGSAADAARAVEAMDDAGWVMLAGLVGVGMPSAESRGMVHRALIFAAALEVEVGRLAVELFR